MPSDAATDGSGRRATGGGEGAPRSAPWGLGVLLALANFVAVLDLTITNVSVPTISGALGASISQGTWVITSYAVAEAITVPLTGWLAGRFGAERVFCIALIAFAGVSFLCAVSPTIGALVACRVLQGAAGGPLMPLSQTLLLQRFPPRLHNQAMGLWSVTTLVAPIAGPVLGGALCESLGWPTIFLINVPVATGVGLVAWRILVRRPHTPVKAPFDLVGLALLIVWVGLLQVTLDLGKDRDWFESPLITAMAAGSAVAFAAFLIWELTSEHPIVNLRVFRHPGYAISMAVFGCALGGFFATNVLTPLWLQTDMSYTSGQAGLAASATGILAMASGPLAASLTNRFDARLVACAGVGWMALTTLLRGLASTDMTFWQIWAVLLMVGAGMPAFFIPLMSLSLGSVDPGELADASGLSSFVRTLSGAFATSIVTTLWDDGAAARHADLVGRLNDLPGVLGGLERGGASHAAALAMVNRLVDGQAVLLSTNQLFWQIACLFGLGAILVWAIPRPAAVVAAASGH